MNDEGKFGAKKAYKLVFNVEGVVSSSMNPYPLWAKTWNFKCQPKIQNYVWRA